MKSRADLSIGDPVEIRVMFHARTSPVGAKNPTPPVQGEKWLPATVTHRDAMQIGVALANGERVAIPLHKTGDYRVPEVTELPTKWGTFTLDHMRQLKECHEAAETDEFECMGGTWLKSFVGYLLEYAQSQGMKL